MKRTMGALMLLAAMGGCVSSESGHSSGGWGSGPPMASNAWSQGPVTIPNVQGAWGQPVTMSAPYNAVPPGGAEAAAAMMSRSMPMDLVQAAGVSNSGLPSGVVQAGGFSPASVPFQAAGPSMGGSCPPGGSGYPPGVVAAVGAITSPALDRFPTKRTEVRFVAPTGMKVSWYAPSPDSRQGFATQSLDVPFNYNFAQAAVYRLKLSHIASRPGVELYPTVEVVPSNIKTDPFLAHSAVPVSFTDEDFEQITAGNYVVKVIYLPEPQFQDLVVTGPDEIVSSRLEPGVDPIAEAARRGNILLIIRVGNINLEAPNTPPMDAPGAYGPKAMGAPGHLPANPGMPSMPQGPGLGMPPGAMMPMQSQPSGPASQLPDTTALQQTQYRQAAMSAAQMAAQTDPSSAPAARNQFSVFSFQFSAVRYLLPAENWKLIHVLSAEH
jgi:hypothetical protein